MGLLNFFRKLFARQNKYVVDKVALQKHTEEWDAQTAAFKYKIGDRVTLINGSETNVECMRMTVSPIAGNPSLLSYTGSKGEVFSESEIVGIASTTPSV